MLDITKIKRPDTRNYGLKRVSLDTSEEIAQIRMRAQNMFAIAGQTNQTSPINICFKLFDRMFDGVQIS